MSNVLNGTMPTIEPIKGNMNVAYGAEGKSAYEVAVKNGFEGSEEEWVASLKGDTGNSGVYIGSGDMPDDCNVQIDPDGDLSLINQVFDVCNSAHEKAQEALDKSEEANEKYVACVVATDNANTAAANANTATEDYENIKQELEKGGFITGIKDINKGITLRFWIGTQKEYADLEEKPKDCYVHFTDINVADYIVEEGTSTVEGYKWHYIKRNSGRCELHSYTTIKPIPDENNGVKGSLYYSKPVTVKFPFAVGERVVIGNAGNVCFVCNMGSGGNYASTDLRLANPLEFSVAEKENGIPVNIVVYGTWK